MQYQPPQSGDVPPASQPDSAAFAPTTPTAPSQPTQAGPVASRAARDQTVGAGLKANRTRLLLIGAGAVGVVVLLITFLLLRGGSGVVFDEKAADKALNATVEDYVISLKDNDPKKTFSLLSEQQQKSRTQANFAATLDKAIREAGGIDKITIKTVDQSGEAATVVYELNTGLGSETWQMRMVKEKGKWKVDALLQIKNTY
jgi:hypothetical protein